MEILSGGFSKIIAWWCEKFCSIWRRAINDRTKRMSFQTGHEPIGDGEILYRRIPVSMGWYDTHGLSPEAFEPRDDEKTGISVFRAKYKSLEEAANGKSKKGYYIAVFRAGDLRANGIEVMPRPEADDPGHAELPNLTCDNRNTNEALEIKSRLTELKLSVEGPFLPHTS
jgi:hypothetical protein